MGCYWQHSSKWEDAMVELTVWLGGDAGGLRGGARSVAVDRQNSDRVLCELVESVHLVVQSAHLHTLDTNTEGRFTLWFHQSQFWRTGVTDADLFFAGRRLCPQEPVAQDGAVWLAGRIPAHLDRGGRQSLGLEGLHPAGNLDCRKHTETTHRSHTLTNTDTATASTTAVITTAPLLLSKHSHDSAFRDF